MRFDKSVLDHGYVRIIDTMGDDNTVVRAARVSFGEEDSKDPAGLINYLMRHRHTSPFEMCEIMMEVKLPIFVARQWVRHRTANINEISGRYVELPDEFFIPEFYHMKATSNKQGRSAKVHARSDSWRQAVEKHNLAAFALYRAMLQDGVAPEEARTHLPLSTYTKWVWKIDLHNLLHFLKLRTDPHAQVEIRAYAEAIEEFVAEWVPLTYAAWVNFNRDAMTISAAAMDNVHKMVSSARPNNASWEGVSAREKREVLGAFGLS